nr:uncharacterized protein LOC105318965 [Crassostrea gigas]
MDFSWSTCFICLLAIFPDSMGQKYLTVFKSLPGTIYFGTRSELIGKSVTANKVQNSFSPLLRPLQQDQFSFDMELCDLVAITRGSFVVADKDEPQSGVMFQCFKQPVDSLVIREIITIMATNLRYEQMFQNQVSRSFG